MYVMGIDSGSTSTNAVIMDQDRKIKAFSVVLTGVLKIEHIQEKADFLLENMAFFFVPAGVSIINYFDVLKNSVVQLIIICVVSTVVTFAVTAWSVKLTVRFMALTGRTGTGGGEGKEENGIE